LLSCQSNGPPDKRRKKKRGERKGEPFHLFLRRGGKGRGGKEREKKKFLLIESSGKKGRHTMSLSGGEGQFEREKKRSAPLLLKEGKGDSYSFFWKERKKEKKSEEKRKRGVLTIFILY